MFSLVAWAWLRRAVEGGRSGRSAPAVPGMRAARQRQLAM